MGEPARKLTLTKDEQNALYHAWRKLFASRQATAVDFLIYALLRGKDPKQGFTPISNARKLCNGLQAEQCYRGALLAVSNMAGHVLSGKLLMLVPTVSPDRLGALVGDLWHESTALFYSKKES